MKKIRSNLTYANIAATLALALALGGTGAYAATLITSAMIKNGTIRSVDIHDRTIKIADLSPQARSRTVAKYDASSGGVAIAASPTTTRFMGPAIPRAGKYLITATTTIVNTNAGGGTTGECAVEASHSNNAAFETKPADFALQAHATGNAYTTELTMQTIATMKKTDYPAIFCTTLSGSAVYMMYSQVIVEAVDSVSETQAQ